MSSQQSDDLQVVFPRDLEADNAAKKLQAIKDNITNKGYILPLRFGDNDKYRLAVLVSCTPNLYLPSKKDSDSFRQAGYIITKDTYAYYHKPSWKYFSYLRKDALITYVAALVAKDNQLLWCENGPHVEQDYAMLLVFLKDPALYFKLRLKPIIYASMSNASNDDNIAMKRWNKLEDKINRRLFRVMESNALIRKHENKIKKLSETITKACDRFKNVDGAREIDEIVQGWKEMATYWDAEASLTARAKFIELFYNNKAGFRSNAPVLLPYPLDEQSIAVDDMIVVNTTIHTILRDGPQAAPTIHDVPHRKGPPQFIRKFDITEPNNLTKSKDLLASLHINGNVLTWEQITELINTYWIYDQEKEALVPKSKSMLAVPIVTSRLLGNNINKLNNIGVVTSTGALVIPTIEGGASTDREQENIRSAEIITEVTSELKLTLNTDAQSYLKYILKEQVSNDAMFLGHSNFESCIQQDISARMSNLIAGKYANVVTVPIKSKLMSDCFHMTIELLRPDGLLKEVLLTYMSYIYGLCCSFSDFLREHAHPMKASRYDSIAVKVKQLIINTTNSNNQESLDGSRASIFNNELKIDFLQKFKSLGAKTNVNDKNSAKPDVIENQNGVKHKAAPQKNKRMVKDDQQKFPGDILISLNYKEYTTQVLVDQLLNKLKISAELADNNEREHRDPDVSFVKVKMPSSLADFISANVEIWAFELLVYLKASFSSILHSHFIYKDIAYLHLVESILLHQFMDYFTATHFTLHSLAYIYKIAAILVIKSNMLLKAIKNPSSKKSESWVMDDIHSSFEQIMGLHIHLLFCFECTVTYEVMTDVDQRMIDLDLINKEIIHEGFVQCQHDLHELYVKTNGMPATTLKAKQALWLNTYTSVSKHIIFEGDQPFHMLNPTGYMSMDRRMGHKGHSKYIARKADMNPDMNPDHVEKDYTVKNCFTNNTLYNTTIAQTVWDTIGADA